MTRDGGSKHTRGRQVAAPPVAVAEEGSGTQQLWGRNKKLEVVGHQSTTVTALHVTLSGGWEIPIDQT